MAKQTGNQGMSTAQAVKAKLSLLDIAQKYMQLRHAGGGRWVAPCPFHAETKPSFSINEQEGFFYCFGCQASGDLIDFYCRINGLEFRDGLAQLAEMAGVELRAHGGRSAQDDEAVRLRRSIQRMHELAEKYYRRNLEAPQAEQARAYVAQRKISREMLETFALGWAFPQWQGLTDELERAGMPAQDAVQAGLLSVSREKSGRPYDRFRGRLIFPIKNLAGQTVAFGGRIVDPASEEAKYINSPESPIYKKGEHLYGLYQARRAIAQAKSVLLTEGYLDVISLHQYGFANSCGVLGTALTPDQVKRLGGFCSRLELIFDGDAAGRKAALRSAAMILTRGLNCQVAILPEGEDIDSLLKTQGPEAFENLRREAPDGLAFCLDALRRDFAPRDMVDWVKEFLGQVAVPELLNRFTSDLCRGLDLDERQIRQGLRRGSAKAAPSPAAAGQGDGPRGSLGQSGGKTSRPAGLLNPDEAKGRELLHFLACFPEHLPDLLERGAEILVRTPFVQGLWDNLLRHGPERIVEHLPPEEKAFWVRCKAVAPLPEDKEIELLEDIRAGIERKIAKQHLRTYKGMLPRLAGEDEEREVLQAIKAMNEQLGNL